MLKAFFQPVLKSYNMKKPVLQLKNYTTKKNGTEKRERLNISQIVSKQMEEEEKKTRLST